MLYQHNKKVQIKFSLLNNKYQSIDELQGDILSGDVTIDGDTDIMRSINVTFLLKNKTYYVNEMSKIWMDKIARVEIGVLNTRTQKIHWYPIGLFVFSEYNFVYNKNENSLTISCLDLMANFTGERNGILNELTTIISTEKGRKIRQVMIDTVVQLGHINKYLIDDIGSEYSHTLDPSTNTYPDEIPYNLQFGTGATIYEILTKLRDIYPAYAIYFDSEGVFCCKRTPQKVSDPVILDYNIIQPLIINESISGTYKDIKNCIQVFGKNNISAKVKLYNKIPDNQEQGVGYVIDPNSMFSVEKIGEVWDCLSGGEYENIYSNQLAKERCEYELWIKTALKDTIDISCILIPFIVPHMKIRYKTTKGDIFDTVIKKISYDFTSNICNITMNKFKPLYQWYE